MTTKKISRTKGHGHPHRPTATDASATTFKGYDLDELRYKLVVNRLKISLTQDRLLMLVSLRMQRNANTLTGYVSGVNSFIRYFDIAMVAFTIFHKLTSIWRFFFPRRQK